MSHRDPVRAGDTQHVQPRWEQVAEIAKDGVRYLGTEGRQGVSFVPTALAHCLFPISIFIQCGSDASKFVYKHSQKRPRRINHKWSTRFLPQGGDSLTIPTPPLPVPEHN